MLPKIDVPIYTIKLLSTGQDVRVTPYTVKQEKTLLLALESKDFDQIIEAILAAIQGCVVDDVDVRTLPSFDVEALFVAIRSKSVGEGVQLKIKCEKCEAFNENAFDLTDFRLSGEVVKDYNVKVTPGVGFVAKYPSLTDMKGILDPSKSAIDQIILIAAKCIDYIYDETQIYKSEETSIEELVNFVEALSGEQFNHLRTFIDGIPKITKDIVFDCKECKHNNQIGLEGLQSFFM